MAKLKGSHSRTSRTRLMKGRLQEQRANKSLSLASDPSAMLGHFAQALSMTVVCQRSLAAQELAAVGDEEETLREAIRLLRVVYSELDGVVE